MNSRRPSSIFNAGAARFAPVGQSVTRPAASGQRPAASGQRPAASGQRPAASGQRPAASGQRPAASGQRPAASGQRPSRQCWQPTPSAPWRRASAPRAEGGRAAFRFGWGDGGSRQRQTHEREPAACEGVRWATLPCPGGARGAAGCAFDAVCPAGKGAAEWRAGSWCVAEGSRVSERFAHQGVFPARRGTGERASPRKGQSFSRTPSLPTLSQ